MAKLFIIAIGGGLGAVLRYIVSGIGMRFSNGVFPLGTLIVNVSGGLIIGFVWGLVEYFEVSPMARLFVLVGVLGGYTTFSSFSLETFHLLREGENMLAFINITGSVAFSIGAVFLGYFLSRFLIGLFIKGGI